MTWAYIPSKSAPELACLAKDCEQRSDIWASRIAPSATLNGKHTPPLSWQRASKKEAWTRLLCGPTFSPSTVQHGMAQWISSLRASRAKTSVSLESVLGLMAPAPGSSSTSSTLPTLAVREASFWRTSQASLLPPPPLWTKPKGILKSEQPPESWENWPTAGGMRNGSLFQRPTWAPAMGGRGGSALRGGWATPNAHDGRRPGADMSSTQGANLNRDAVKWATPDCNTSTYSNGMKGPNLREQASGWPTPRSTDGTKGGPNQAGSKGDLMLPSAAAQWPTPAARDAKGANSEEHCTVTGGGAQAHGPTEQLRRPFFAPGPADPGWRDILQQWPELAPALEPGFRGMVDGVAFAMDESRAQRLKCIGNGVVPLCAAAAAVVLIRRAIGAMT